MSHIGHRCQLHVPKLRGLAVPKMTALSPSPQRGTDLSPNADPERGLSILGNIRTDQRPSTSLCQALNYYGVNFCSQNASELPPKPPTSKFSEFQYFHDISVFQ